MTQSFGQLQVIEASTTAEEAMRRTLAESDEWASRSASLVRSFVRVEPAPAHRAEPVAV
jgi:hypothetical protein